MLNLFAVRKGLLGYVNNFKVRMLSPSTIEDSDRDEQLDSRIRMTNDLISIFQNNDAYDQETVNEIIVYLTNSFLNKPEIASILEKSEQDNNQEASQEVASETEDSSEDISRNSMSTFSDSFDFEEPSEEIDTNALVDVGVDLTNTEASPEENDAGFGDYEEFA